MADVQLIPVNEREGIGRPVFRIAPKVNLYPLATCGERLRHVHCPVSKAHRCAMDTTASIRFSLAVLRRVWNQASQRRQKMPLGASGRCVTATEGK